MDSPSNIDFNPSTFPSTTPAGNGVQGVPPPPPEVKVRTLRSDVEAMAKSGGGLPRYENVPVSGLAIEKGMPGSSQAKKGEYVTAILIIVVLLILAGGLYYFYTKFFSTTNQPADQTGALVVPGNNQVEPTSTATSSAPNFTHVTLFKKPVDQILSIVFSPPGSVATAGDLQSYSQKMAALFITASGRSNFVEISAKSSDGHVWSMQELLAQAGAPIIDSQTLSHFSPDPTFFAYRERGAFWPGYVLSLKDGENWLFLKPDVAKLESLPSIASLFVANPGTPSLAGFSDVTVASTSVRVLPFSAASTSFVYGWVKNELILSTSLNGFKEAVLRLQDN